MCGICLKERCTCVPKDTPESKQLNPKERAALEPQSRKYAIKAYCWECSGNNLSEVTRCEYSGCPLYNFRKG